MSEKLRKMAKDAGAGVAQRGLGHRPRGHHTLSLDSANYQALKRHCQEAGIPLSDVVDAMIEGFLEQAKKPAGKPK